MLTAMTLLAALHPVPGQQPPAGGLALTNARLTFGSQYGPVRPDARFLPGDLFFLVFDIDNLKVGEDGKVVYNIVMQVTDKTGKPVFQQPPPPDITASLSLGGNKLPAMAFVILATEQEPGAYTCKVIVTDKQANTSQSLERPFEVLPKNFGVIGVYTSLHPNGEVAVPPQGIVGQTIYLHFGVVGFARNANTKQPNTSVMIAVTDEAGRPTTAKPIVLTIDQADEKAPAVMVFQPFPLNRPGKFTVKITVSDRLANKTAEYALTITVTEPAK